MQRVIPGTSYENRDPTPLTATITSGVIFNDTAGRPVHAHGAGLILPDVHPAGASGRYFMVGTTEKLPPSWLSEGINLYSSPDLQHWTFEAEIFRASQARPATAKRIERPKLLYNAATKRYVLWFHLDDAAFSLGFVGVATATSINETFQFAGGWRPDGERSLDMSLFLDGPRAFLVRSVDNRFTGFSQLTADYLNTTSDGIVSRGPRCEGIAVWREGGVWNMLCSQLTGWHANPALLASSSSASITGARWTVLGNPTHRPLTFDSQPTYVLPLDLAAGRGAQAQAD